MFHFVTAVLAVAMGLAFADEGKELASGNKPDPTPVVPAKDTIPEPLVQLGQGKFFSNHAFLMDKANRTLTIWKRDGDEIKLVTAVAADFGRNNGDKISSGDHKTPEGIYFFQEMKEGKTLDFDLYGVRAFTLDYPNFFDGLEKKSGSGIWLHAIPNSKSLMRGSRGCVVVRNDVIKTISQYVALKRTPMLIQDNVKYVTVAEAQKLRQTWQTWLENWRKQWEGKNLDSYIEFYSDSFSALGMDRDKWRQYKKELNEKYDFIKVELTEPLVLHHNDELVVRFLQNYQSDKKSDFGEKTLYLRRKASDFKIIGEEWKATRRDEIVATH